MTSQTIDIQDTMNRLIEVCHDSESLFATASNAVAGEEPLLKAELMQYSFQRGDFALDLEHELASVGEEPVHRGTIAGAVHRGWLNLKHVVSGDERFSILNECLRSENASLEAYQAALSADLPSPLPNIVRTQYAAIERVRDRIQALRDAAEPKHP
jgi:uncharacterized protein (TIGR02284 family)